jgi:hypothetical protein
LDFYLRASEPESSPAVGLPTLLRDDFTTIKVEMASDPALPAMQINEGVVLPGTIVVNPDPDSLDAPWTLLGPDGSYVTSHGDVILNNREPGPYTITWQGVAGWTTPAPQTSTLVTGETIEFAGTYFYQFSDEMIGLYFDTGGTSNTVAVGFLDHATAYILYMNPSIAATGGFECGFDLSKSTGTLFNTLVSVSYPTQSVDVGTNYTSAGIYNYIVGFGSPLLTSGRTVMATLDFFFLEQMDVFSDLRGAIPSSTDGPPAVMTSDYERIIPVAMPTGPGVPDLTFLYQ